MIEVMKNQESSDSNEFSGAKKPETDSTPYANTALDPLYSTAFDNLNKNNLSKSKKLIDIEEIFQQRLVRQLQPPKK